jgi:hypothetical protein
MFDEHTTSFGGEVIEKPKVKKPTRAERIAAWRKENEAAYTAAANAHACCTPTRAQMIILEQWRNPPV